VRGLDDGGTDVPLPIFGLVIERTRALDELQDGVSLVTSKRLIWPLNGLNGL